MTPAPDTAQAPLLVQQHDGVLTLTLNRPAALNSFTAEMHGLLLPALEAAAADPAVRVVVITGAGLLRRSGPERPGHDRPRRPA